EPDELVVRGPDGRYASEIVVPFVRVPKPAAAAPRTAGSPPARSSAPSPAAPAGEVRRNFPPGSEWFYAKLYTGQATADQILTETIAPIVADQPAWFFIRYGDPHWHVRFRAR